MLYRLRNDFQLSVISLLGVFAILGITPFALWRFVIGDTLIGTIDTAILLGIIGAVAYAWRTGRNDHAGLFLAAVPCTMGGIAVATLVGEAGLFWLYPALICSYFMTRPWIATALALTALVFLTIEGSAFHSPTQQWSFVTTVAVVSICAYVFARRNEDQRVTLQRLALIDPLTGTRNRRAMDAALEQALGDHDRQTGDYALVLVDLDHFKAVNDQHGHTVGDRILVEFSSMLTENTRRSDQVFRFGGEEFVLLLSGVTEQTLTAAVDHLQQATRRSLKSPSGNVTASFGVTLLHPSDSPQSVLERADRALYQAKAQGRDRIVIEK